MTNIRIEEPRRMEDRGLVYFVLDATRHNIFLKIGHTTALRLRMARLREVTASGQEPLVLALEEGGFPQETARHEQFAKLRSHGEWFRYEGELEAFVASLEHPHSFLLDRPHLWEFAKDWGPISVAAGLQRPFRDGRDDKYVPPIDF